MDLQLNAKKKARKHRREQATKAAKTLKEDLPHTQASKGACSGKGVSSWLTVLSLDEFGLSLPGGPFKMPLCSDTIGSHKIVQLPVAVEQDFQ